MSESAGDRSLQTAVLIGAGRHGHNVIGLLEDAGICIKAVLDDAASGSFLKYSITALRSYEGPVWNAYLAVGLPEARRVLVDRLTKAGFHLLSFADSRAVISRYAELGVGSFVGPLSALADVCLEQHVSVIGSCVIGAQVRVGAFTTVAPHVTIGSDARIGTGCMLGMGCRIEAGVTIGDHCLIAPNALVRRDIPPRSLVAGGDRTRIAERRD